MQAFFSVYVFAPVVKYINRRGEACVTHSLYQLTKQGRGMPRPYYAVILSAMSFASRPMLRIAFSIVR
jgi:hypothetical protein